jgi:ribose transport system substrate-binding protein
VRVTFSGPVADHGFLAAINSFANKQAATYSDVELKVLEAAADAPAQIAAVQTAIAEKPDALIIFPQDGDQLTGVGKAAMAAGIPVINLDRKFNDQSAYRLFLAGDNCKVGWNAGQYIGQKLKGKTDAIIGEITGIQTLTLTQERSQGFKDALAINGLNVSRQVNAQFTVQSGQQAMAHLLAAAPRLDAVFNHDDDQNIGLRRQPRRPTARSSSSSETPAATRCSSTSRTVTRGSRPTSPSHPPFRRPPCRSRGSSHKAETPRTLRAFPCLATC